MVKKKNTFVADYILLDSAGPFTYLGNFRVH